jgi:hypothetical protein
VYIIRNKIRIENKASRSEYPSRTLKGQAPRSSSPMPHNSQHDILTPTVEEVLELTSTKAADALSGSFV